MSVQKFQIEQDLSKVIENFTVDTTFLDFLNQTKSNKETEISTLNIETEVQNRLQKNFRELEDFGQKICEKINLEVESVLKNEKLIEKSMKKNLIVKMKEFLIFFKSLNLPPHMISSFPMSPYHNSQSQAFIEAAKFGKTERLKCMIEKENNEIFFPKLS